MIEFFCGKLANICYLYIYLHVMYIYAVGYSVAQWGSS